MTSGIGTTLGQVTRWLEIAPCRQEVEFTGISTDSRQTAPGELFVALRGPRHDAHEHVAEAAGRGAVAALVERPLEVAVPQLVVADTRLALGELARAWRAACGATVVAVTGSNGKTTVKEMLAAILGVLGPTLATQGNLNNDIGVPLTLLRLEPAHRYAVVEMGANHPGEIAYLTALARPDVALITNAAAAHLEGFGSLDGVARAKGEIFEGLGRDGIAVVNADDPYASLWRRLAGGHAVIQFGSEPTADVSAAWEPAENGTPLTLHTPNGELHVALPLPGRHNVMNALAAAAAALAAGASPEAVKTGLEAVRPVSGRMQFRRAHRGGCLIDDSYNANPGSLASGLEVLAARPGRRLLVLGDMAELGTGAEEMHRAAGERARALGIDGLYAAGPLSRCAVEAFGGEGHHFDDTDALVDALEPHLAADVTVLVKGSRSARMERVAAALADEGEG